jgi:hypothetical protein
MHYVIISTFLWHATAREKQAEERKHASDQMQT